MIIKHKFRKTQIYKRFRICSRCLHGVDENFLSNRRLALADRTTLRTNGAPVPQLRRERWKEGDALAFFCRRNFATGTKGRSSPAGTTAQAPTAHSGATGRVAIDLDLSRACIPLEFWKNSFFLQVYLYFSRYQRVSCTMGDSLFCVRCGTLLQTSSANQGAQCSQCGAVRGLEGATRRTLALRFWSHGLSWSERDVSGSQK